MARGITENTKTAIINLSGNIALELSNLVKMESIYTIHKSSNGDQVMICQMDDDHLKATVNRMFHHLAESHPSNFQEETLDPLTASLTNNLKTDFQEESKSRFLFLLKCTEPYILELTIRGMVQEFTPALQILFDRDKAVNAPKHYRFAEKLKNALPPVENLAELEAIVAP